MKTRRTSITLLTLFLHAALVAQFVDNARMQTEQNKIVYIDEQDVNHINFFKKLGPKLGLSEGVKMQLKDIHRTGHGTVKYRYAQTYKGLPVFGTYYTLHERNGQVNLATGYVASHLNVDTYPAISKQQAIDAAIRAVGLNIDDQEFMFLPEFKYDHNATSLCVIDIDFPDITGSHTLAYEVILERSHPEDKRQVFVNAANGELIFEQSLICHYAVKGTGVTKYYGTQSIIVDSVSPNRFLLRDPTRNVISIDSENKPIEGNSKDWDLTNSVQDEVIIDGHYCTMEFYDMMLNRFNWEGIDNNGGALKIEISSDFFINASWNGTRAYFGRGDCNHGPLTTMEVVGHEFMHGVTDYTSDLIYAKESGAINESMSDVFGKALEYYSDHANFNWYLGKSFFTTPYGRFIRSMSDPHERRHPKMYKGEYWIDEGIYTVHTNSAIGNHWFYLLVEGRSSVNEADTAFNVQALGMDKALQIVFLTQRSYLGPNSTYSDYYSYSILAAEEIHGQGAWEVESVKEAWKAVGLPRSLYIPGFDLSLKAQDLIMKECLNNKYIDLELEIRNEGSKDFIASHHSAKLMLNGTIIDEFTTDIPAGGFYSLMVKNAFFVENTGDTVLQTRLDMTDEDTSNNQATQTLYNSNPDGHDLRIRHASQFYELNCELEVTRIRVDVQNVSCFTLPKGDSLRIQITEKNSSYVYNYSAILNRDLAELSGDYYSFVIPKKFVHGSELQMKLHFKSDISVGNNEFQITVNSPDEITTTYLDSFNTFTGSKYIRNYFFQEYIYQYQGESYLALTGPPAHSVYATPCPDAEETLNAHTTGTFGMCVDLQNMNNPYLSFDVIQFRNDSNTLYPTLSNNEAILKVKWKGMGIDGQDIIYGLPEGDIFSYDYALPANFEGKIQFTYFCLTGHSGDINNFLEYDVILMDNLKIDNRQTTHTIDESETYSRIYPNPSKGVFFMDHKERVLEITVQNIHGQSVESHKNPSFLELDLSEYASGVYHISILYAKVHMLLRGWLSFRPMRRGTGKGLNAAPYLTTSNFHAPAWPLHAGKTF